MSDQTSASGSQPTTHPDPAQPSRFLGRIVRAAAAKQGRAPGTLEAPPVPRDEPSRLRVVSYDEEQLVEREIDTLEEIGAPKRVTWINLDGVYDVERLRQIGERFDLHPLLVEDVATVGQRPKFEDYDPYLFVVLPMLTVAPDDFHVTEEQITFVLGDGILLTFQERRGDVFEPVRERFRQRSRRIRSRGADYLCYALMDAVVDGYFTVLDRLGSATEVIDEELNDEPGPQTIRRIHELKRETMILRKSVWPLRETLASLSRSESELVTDETRLFLRDVYDHAVHVIDTTESIRDVVSGMIDLYLSLVGHRTNEVMRLLTVMASIFIPLTFLAGIYGMNFENMPELGQPLGYPILLSLMGLVAGGLLIYFRRKGWL